MPIRSAAHVAFGYAVREARARQGMSQEALAHVCGLDRTYISGIERGTRNPSLMNILRLADALNTTPADLFAAAACEERDG